MCTRAVGVSRVEFLRIAARNPTDGGERRVPSNLVAVVWRLAHVCDSVEMSAGTCMSHIHLSSKVSRLSYGVTFTINANEPKSCPIIVVTYNMCTLN